MQGKSGQTQKEVCLIIAQQGSLPPRTNSQQVEA